MAEGTTAPIMALKPGQKMPPAAPSRPRANEAIIGNISVRLDPTKSDYEVWYDEEAGQTNLTITQGVLDCAVEVDACKEPGLGGTGEDDGHWQMPVGTVLVKNFSIEGKLVETRLLMRRSTSNLTGWKGFSYEWNDAQTEANLLPDDTTGKDKPVGTAQQVWHYPSRAQCMDCHTRYAGRSLGPSTAQLNSDFNYADGAMNQLDKLQQLGLFDAAPKAIEGYPDPAGADATLEQRARSYIHTNCAICHRPGGEFSSIDMRYATAFVDSKMCDKIERDAGKVPDYRITPGDPLKSGMSVRMHALDMLRMPKSGSNVVDPAGSKLIDDWITAMPSDACPPQQ